MPWKKTVRGGRTAEITGAEVFRLKIFRNPGVMWREEDDYKEQAYQGLEKGEDVGGIGTSVLYSGREMLSLNILGTEIWKRCDGKTIDEIAFELAGIFDVETEALKKDAAGFISELKEKGYLYEE